MICLEQALTLTCTDGQAQTNFFFRFDSSFRVCDSEKCLLANQAALFHKHKQTPAAQLSSSSINSEVKTLPFNI